MDKSGIQAAPARPVAPNQPRGAQAISGMTGADILRIIRRRLVLISVITAFFVVVFTVGVVFWRSSLPRYTAVASVEVSPPQTSFLEQNNPYRNADLLDRYKHTAAVWFKSRPVLTAALESEEMKQTLWYQSVYAKDPSLNEALTELEDKLSLSIQPNNDYIVVRMSQYCSDSQQKEQLPSIVNAIANAFVDRVNENQASDRSSSIQSLRQRMTTLSTSITANRDERLQLLSKAEIPVMRRQMDSISMELDQLLKNTSELQMQRANIEKSLEGFKAMILDGTIEANENIQQAVDSDPILRNLESDLTTTKASLDILESRLGPMHRQRRILEVKIQGLEREIKHRRDEVIRINKDSAMASMEQDLVMVTTQLSENANNQRGLFSKRRDLNTTLLKVEDLETQIEEKSRMLNELDNKITDLELVSKQNQTAKLHSPAVIPLNPSGPSYAVWIAMGIFLGLGLGLGLAFLIELSDTSVKTPTDIISRLGMPLLAMLPHSDDMEEEVDDYRSVCAQLEHTMINESFRELRSNLDFSGPIEKRRTMLITSPSPGDGRTSVALNLALTISRSGRKVLVVDANFRRPELGNVLKIEQDRGLSDILSGQATADDCISESQFSNLYVLQAGQLPPNPNELLSSSLADKLVDELSSKFDQVIFDGPPSMLISEARVLANRLDSVVLVVRAGENSMGIVNRCRSILDRAGANILGVVLNGIRSTTGGYLLKNYEAFTDYHLPEDELV